jgi:hypothetical protein
MKLKDKRKRRKEKLRLYKWHFLLDYYDEKTDEKSYLFMRFFLYILHFLVHMFL